MSEGSFDGPLFAFRGNKFASANAVFAGDIPEIHGRVSSPRSPSFGALLKLARSFQSQRTHKTEVTRWKRIGLPECSHRHVLRCPFANARNFT